MYGIFTYIYPKDQANGGKYTIQGCYGFELFCTCNIDSEKIGRSTPNAIFLKVFPQAPNQPDNSLKNFL